MKMIIQNSLKDLHLYKMKIIIPINFKTLINPYINKINRKTYQKMKTETIFQKIDERKEIVYRKQVKDTECKIV